MEPVRPETRQNNVGSHCNSGRITARRCRIEPHLQERGVEMSREIRKLAKDQDFEDFISVYINAYPGVPTDREKVTERMKWMQENDPNSNIWGLWDDGRLIGGERLIDFKLNYFGQFIPAGGVGMVAVDLLEKKRGAAKDLISYFLDYCEDHEEYMAMLYPFRPDFYHQMGFGYGTRMDKYCFEPTSLPGGGFREGLAYLTADDGGALTECYNEFAAGRHGYCRRADMTPLAKGYGPQRKLVGYRHDGKLLGYLVLDFQKGGVESNFVKNYLVINEWISLTQEAFLALAGFIHTQADQFFRVEYHTQNPDFYFALKDVRNGTDEVIPHVYHESNTAGVGLMYRIVNFRRLLEVTAVRNYGGMDAELTIKLTDTFRPQNAGEYNIEFRGGTARLADKKLAGMRIELDVSDLSSLFMGAVDIGSLYRLGRLIAREEDLPVLQRVFHAWQKPECVSGF
jgi:predicted acetyltransferase